MFKPNKYPKICTAAAKAYYLADIELINFLAWIAYMTGSMDEIAKIVREENANESTKPSQKTMLDELRRNRRILMSMLYVRMIDNYFCYLTGILKEAFCSRPEILRTSEKIEIVEVLSFQSINELIVHLADKKVYDLSYKSLTDLYDYFQDRLGVKLVTTEQQAALIEAVESRNLIVHNRGIKNKRYCSRVGEDMSMVGKIRDISGSYANGVNLMLFDSVKKMDSTIRKKMKIKGLFVGILKEFHGKVGEDKKKTDKGK
jgi:hypothetical protein